MPNHVVLLVENESVPTDRRVWEEAVMLRDAGLEVTVVCPTGEGRDSEPVEERDGITIRRFTLERAEDGIGGFLREYATALWRMARVVWTMPGPISAVHSANPPDFLFLIGLVPKLRWKTKLVFDHHDLMPELFESRFTESGLSVRLILAIVRMVERVNFRLADAVISTNESYRQIAIDRGRKRPEQVRVVRNARQQSTFARVEADPDLRRGKAHMAVYVGTMGPQDGAACAVRMAASFKHDLGRDDLHVMMVGDGDARPEAEELARHLDVDEMVEFVGWQEREDVIRYLSTADIGLATDPSGPLNDHSTMIKVIEYLAMGLPVVSFDLAESIVSAGDAALYTANDNEADMARNVAKLLDDADLRRDLSDMALERSTGPLSWETSRQQLLDTYQYLGVLPGDVRH